MADKNIQIAVTAQDQASSTLGKIAGQFQALDRQVEQSSRRFTEINTAITSMAGALTLAGVAAFTKSVLDAGLQMEKMNRLFSAAAGSASLGARELEYARQVSEKMGLSFAETAESYGKFLAAIKNTTLEGEKGRKVFESVSGASTALGLSADETKGVFNALQQMMSKGNVQTEELRGQLGERLPGAFKLAADAMGITTAELDKMLKDGKVAADELLPKLAEQLNKTYGKAATEGAQSAAAELNRFNNAMLEARATAGSALIPVFTDLLKAIKPALEMLKEFIGGIQILAVRIPAFIDRTYLARTSAEANASRQAEDETIAEIMKKFSATGTDYNAAELARQRAFKPAKMAVGDSKKSDDQSWISAHEKYLAYLKAYEAQQTAIVKTAAAETLEVNRQAYELGLIDHQTYIKAKLAATEAELTAQITAQRKIYDEQSKLVDEYGARFKNTQDAKSANAYHGALEKQQQSLNKILDLEGKLGLARKKGNFDAKKDTLDQDKRLSDLNARLLETAGRYEEAARARWAFEQTTPEYKRASTDEKKKLRQQAEVNIGKAGRRQRQNDITGSASAQISAYGGGGYAGQMFDYQSAYNERLEELKSFKEQELLTEQEYQQKSLQAEELFQAQKTNMMLDAASQSAAVMAKAFGDSKEAQIAALILEKSIAVARIMISTEIAAAGVKAAYAMVPGGLAIAAAQEAAIRAMSYVSIGMVLASGIVEGVQIAGKRALGGPVKAGQTYLVNENRATQGPEYFTPGADGFITPADKVGGGFTQHVTIDARGSDSGVSARIQSAMRQAKEEAKAEIMSSMNRGSAFSRAVKRA